MTKMSEYKVVFVVYATIHDMYDNTGCIVYSGTTHAYGGYSLNNAKVSLAICARSPRDAYNHGLQMIEEGNVNPPRLIRFRANIDGASKLRINFRSCLLL